MAAQFSSVTQSCVTIYEPMPFTNSQSLLKFTSIESVMPSKHLILCHPLLLVPSIFPSIKVFSNKPVFQVRLPKYWSFSISPSNEYSFTEDNCFTILCCFLLYINTNQPKVYIRSPPSWTFSPPTALSFYRASDLSSVYHTANFCWLLLISSLIPFWSENKLWMVCFLKF